MKIEVLLIIIGVLVFIATSLISYLKQEELKISQDKADTENEKIVIEKANHYINLLLTIVDEVVKGFNQTVVDELKKDGDGKLTKEEARDIFNQAKDEVERMLTNEAYKFLNEFIRDVPAFITWAIEAAVKRNK